MEGIVGKGTYFVFKDSIQLAKLGPADIFKATYTAGVVRVMVNGVEKGRGKSIRLIQDKHVYPESNEWTSLSPFQHR